MALAAARLHVRNAERKRDEMTDEQVRTLFAASRIAFDGSAGSHEFRGDEIRLYFQYERHLAHLITENDAALAALRTEETERRAELVEALKRRRIVEVLKERHRKAFLAALNKADQKLLDETATNAAARRRSAASS